MRAVVLVCLAACRYEPQLGANGDGAGPPADVPIARDAPIDASMALESNTLCLGSFIAICVDAPANAPELPATLDTDTAPQCVPYTATPPINACVIAGTSIAISQTFAVTGVRPLILVANGAITVSGGGVVDVASHRQAGTVGAGGDSAVCSTQQMSATNNNTNGGGWGGSFGGQGANGGNGGAIQHGSGGKPTAATGSSTLRGGCPGGVGAASQGFAATAGTAGHGGGALYLLAGATITISGTGTINASGSGGGGGGKTNGGTTGGGGGGGAGSGGMIVLESGSLVEITGSGQVFANGAGGGEGASSGSSGDPGFDPTVAKTAALGGFNGSGAGGDGGSGSVGATAPRNGGTGGGSPIPTGGGGGGGGGAGVIRVIAPATTGTTDPNHISPLPS